MTNYVDSEDEDLNQTVPPTDPPRPPSVNFSNVFPLKRMGSGVNRGEPLMSLLHDNPEGVESDEEGGVKDGVILVPEVAAPILEEPSADIFRISAAQEDPLEAPAAFVPDSKASIRMTRLNLLAAVRASRKFSAIEIAEIDDKAPVELKRRKSNFAYEAAKVFSWLDNDGDGFITDQEISKYLDISTSEAQALIIEAHMQLYGRRQPNGFKLTFDEFTSMLASAEDAETETMDEVPKRTLKRYRIVFDSIDVNRTGVITPNQLAQDMGMEALEGLEGKQQLTFEDFVKILRRAETGRAARMMRKLLEDKEQGEKLADAAEMRKRVIIDEPSEKVTKMIQELWQSTGPTNHLSHIDNIRATLLEQLSSNTLTASDDDIMQILVTLSGKVNAKNQVTYADFFTELQSFLEDPEESEAPMFRKADSRSTIGWEAPSETLSATEFEVFRTLFDENDKDHDGFLSIDQLRELTMSLIEKQLIRPDVRMFYFQLLKTLGDSGEESIDFEQFVVLMQEAAEATALDLGYSEQSGWEIDVIGSLRNIQLKKSRHSMRFTGLNSKQ
eukprot:c9595_g1_i1.p1 GENE.c9595_g1_i1~~c9595_g1_i1.p1  ORF type:complete len:628 (+),score=225.80 c9595_g1_i1:214-1884(+)